MHNRTIRSIQRSFDSITSINLKNKYNDLKLYANLYDYIYYKRSYYLKFLRIIYKKLFIELLKENPNIKSALDIGCGTGESTFLLYNLGIKNITGVDPNPYIINIAKKKFPFIVFKEMGFENIPVLNNKFDLVCSVHGPINHTNPFRAIKNVKKILNDNGIFVFDIFSNFSGTFGLNKELVTYINFRKRIGKKRVRVKMYLYNPLFIEKILKQEEFNIIKRISLFSFIIPKTTKPVTNIKIKLSCWLDYILFKDKIRGNMIIYVCKKKNNTNNN